MGNTKQNQSIYRRFKVIDKNKEQAVFALIKQKGLSHEDIELILKTLVLANKTKKGARE